MKPMHKLTIATALSATLATALIAGPAMASPTEENKPTGPTIANGDNSTACRANWIAEAEVALVLADALSDHAGGRSVSEMRRNLQAYLSVVGERA